MSNNQSPSEYLVISRGQWDEDKSPQEIQEAIDAFYEWHGCFRESAIDGFITRSQLASFRIYPPHTHE